MIMHRRQWLASAAVRTAAVALPVELGLSGCDGPPQQQAMAIDRALQWTTLAQADADIGRLAASATRRSTAVWSWAQTLEHCAQSIDYSMAGYPQPKPLWFRRTVGPAALGVFVWRGRMSHDVAEPIPGAPALDRERSPDLAMAQVRAAMQRFAQWTGPLQPHFAYGVLDKTHYEQAHAMHLANHLSAFEAGT